MSKASTPLFVAIDSHRRRDRFAGVRIRSAGAFRRAGTSMIRPTSALALAILCTTLRALACGGFFSSSNTSEHPSLAHEQVLLAYDARGRKEHFVRRVVFRRTDGVFGFVVPVPSRPEVASVPGNPFRALDEWFPFRRPPA